MYYSEKETKNLLKNNRFKILKSFYVSKISEVEKIIKKFVFPIVLKISGKKIIHKNKLGGVILNLKNYNEVLKSFKKLKKIKDVEEIVIQKQIKGKEIFLGVKKTPEFGHVICFGSGGINVEKKKDISFRVFPLNKKDIEEIINERKISKKLNKKEKFVIKKNLLKLNKFVKKYKNIKELDINPLILNNNSGYIVDARMVLNR